MHRADLLGCSSGFELDDNEFSFSVSTFLVSTFLRIKESVTLCSLVLIAMGYPDFEVDDTKDKGKVL